MWIALFWCFVQAPASAAGQETPSVDSLHLFIDDQTLKVGSEVCIPVRASSASQLLGMQFTLFWETGKLALTVIQGGVLEKLNDQNFGKRLQDKGVLTFSWIDYSLEGVKLDEGAVLFRLCFEVRAPAGSRIAIGFRQAPTPYEAVDRYERLLPVRTRDGTLLVK